MKLLPDLVGHAKYQMELHCQIRWIGNELQSVENPTPLRAMNANWTEIEGALGLLKCAEADF